MTDPALQHNPVHVVFTVPPLIVFASKYHRPSSAIRSRSLAFTTPGAPSSEIIAVDTRTRGVLPTERKAMTQTLTGQTSTVDFLHMDYFPLTYPLLFPHGGVCGWHPNLKSTTGNKISLVQWVTQLLLTESRFQKLGPLVNEFLIDVFSCIEDQRLSFHAFNQDKYKTSVHHASASARIPRPRRDKAVGADRVIIPSSYTQGFADQAKKLTEAMAIVRHFGPAHYFRTVTCNTVSAVVWCISRTCLTTAAVPTCHGVVPFPHFPAIRTFRGVVPFPHLF